MARVTVEDCLDRVENRFALVLLAAQRTRQILKGSPTLVNQEKGNKEAVTALREIAAGLVQFEDAEAKPRVVPVTTETHSSPIIVSGPAPLRGNIDTGSIDVDEEEATIDADRY